MEDCGAGPRFDQLCVYCDLLSLDHVLTQLRFKCSHIITLKINLNKVNHRKHRLDSWLYTITN